MSRRLRRWLVGCLLAAIVATAGLAYLMRPRASKPREPSPEALRALRSEMRVLEKSHGDAQRMAASFAEDGGIGLAKLTSASAIDNRLGRLDRAAGANAKMLDSGDRAEADLSTRLSQSAVPPGEPEQILEQFRREFRWDVGRRVYAANEKVYASARELLQFLRQHFGEWEYDARINGVVFKSTPLRERFDLLQNNVDLAFRAQQAIQSRPEAGAARGS